MDPRRPPWPRRKRLAGSTRGWMLGALVLVALLALAAWHTLYWGQDLRAADFDYPATRPRAACAQGDRGSPDATMPRLRVKAPLNYRPDHPHGLLVVFSPAGFGPALTERFMGLTRMATRQGLVVAYVGSRPLSVELAADLARVPQIVARDWCIDPARIAFAGHSDGGTLAQVVALQSAGAGTLRPRAIVASGGGLLESDFGALGCTTAPELEVLILHGRNDRHFPDYGASATRGWARCLGCAPAPDSIVGECARYAGCRGRLTFCQHDGRHWTWPRPFREPSVQAAATPPPPPGHGRRPAAGV